VQRLKSKHGFSDIPTAETVALSKKIEEANATYTVLASELADVGFNMNFGPVVDLNLVPTNPVIGAKARSYGADPVKVQLYAKAFVEAHKKQNMLTAIKHFPGHGSSWTDSHEQFVDLSSSWQSQELAPYRGLMKAGLVDMVMVGHLYHPAFSDNDKRPASLSRTAITKRLRGELGFKGLVITDDLGMGAVKKYFEFSEALILAVNAGNDILLIAAGHYASEKDVAMILKTLLDAVASGRIKKARIRRSYERIIAAKKKLAAVETY
jgi:beta-N-acetylhexosaminidase